MSEAKQTQKTKRRPDPPKEIQGNNITARVIRQKIWQPANWNDDWCMFVIVGREGSGKSHTQLSILEKVDPSFGAHRVFFDPQDFLAAVNDIPADERQGKAMMLDESGVGMGVRSWHDTDQVNLNKLLQTARDDNMIIGMTLPRLSELDSQTRGRLHGFCEMREVDEEGDYAIWSWKNVVASRDEKDRLIKPYPRLRIRGKKRKVSRLAIGPPSDGLVEDYEERKAEFKARLYEETLEGMQDEEEDKKSPKEVAEEIIDGEVSNYINKHNGNGMLSISWKLIKAEYGLSRHDSKTAKELIEREDSVDLEEAYDGD